MPQHLTHVQELPTLESCFIAEPKPEKNHPGLPKPRGMCKQNCRNGNGSRPPVTHQQQVGLEGPVFCTESLLINRLCEFLPRPVVALADLTVRNSPGPRAFQLAGWSLQILGDVGCFACVALEPLDLCAASPVSVLVRVRCRLSATCFAANTAVHRHM